MKSSSIPPPEVGQSKECPGTPSLRNTPHQILESFGLKSNLMDLYSITNRTAQNRVLETIQWFVSRRKQFTGYDVWNKLKKSAELDPFPKVEAVVSYLQEIFVDDLGAELFVGYACYPITPMLLLFFPPTPGIKKKVETLMNTLEAINRQDKAIDLGG